MIRRVIWRSLENGLSDANLDVLKPKIILPSPMLQRIASSIGKSVPKKSSVKANTSKQAHLRPKSSTFKRVIVHAAWLTPICALLIHTAINMSKKVATTSKIEPPVAERIPRLSTVHNKVNWEDPYYYFREEDNEKALAYLRAENEYTESQMEVTKDLQNELYKEMRSRIRETDSSVPYRMGDWYYYTRTLEGQQYSIHCRKKDDPDIGREEILIDMNVLAADKPFLTLGIYEVSPDGNVLAFSLDESGDEDFELFFKDLRTGKLLDSRIKGTEYSLEWANDNKTVFYTKIDDTHRPYQVYRYTIGDSAGELVFEENDQRFYVSLEKTRDEKYIFISSAATLTTEVLYLDANKPPKTEKFKIFATRRQGVEYQLDHQNGSWMIVTNADGAKNFKLMAVPVAEWALDDVTKWRELLAPRADVKLDHVDCFQRHLAIWEREKGFTKLRIKNLMTTHTASVEFPELSYTVRPSFNREYDANVLRITYTSMTTPRTTIDYNMLDGTRIIRKEEVVNGYEKSQYETVREFALSKDGATQIPISIVYKKGVERNGTNPTILYGYGSYGISIDPSFHQEVISLLDRGMVYAIAHIRGGGELGRPWYEAGKLLTKQNTFDDFVQASRHLIERKYTNPAHLGIWGASAGGLLMGAVTNMAPELYRAVIADVPFVDVMNTMLDPSLPLVVNEYEEWGNPTEKEAFEYMLSYSPYDNVLPKAYPAILAIGGINDPRVKYWEPAKWVAKLRHVKTDNNLILLKTEMDQGHGGASGRFDALKEEAFRYAFMLVQLGVFKAPSL